MCLPGGLKQFWYGPAEDLRIASKRVRKCVHRLIVCKAYTIMHTMLKLGGLGVRPPEIFEKLHPLRLNLRTFLMICNPP